jgi:hypothetical protein
MKISEFSHWRAGCDESRKPGSERGWRKSTVRRRQLGGSLLYSVTDALKRALRCYGDLFGNSLYDTDIVDGQEGVLTAEGIKNEREFAQREKTYKTATRQEGGERSSRPASTKKKYSREQITAHYIGKFAEVKTKDGAEALWAEAKELYLNNGYTEADLVSDLKQIYVEAWYATQGKVAPQTQVA